MKIQKIVALLLVALMAVGSVFANGNGEAGSDEVTLKVLAYGDEAIESSLHIKTLLEKFDAENPNINVEYELLYDEIYHQKLQATLAGGEQLDLYYAWNGGMRHQPVFDAGQELDHTPYIDASTLSDKGVLIPSSDQNANGAVLTYAEGKSAHTVVFANEDLLAEYGLEVATTYEEVLEQDAVLRAAGLRAVAYPGSTAWCHNTFLYSQLLARFGGAQHVANIISRKAAFTDEPTVKSFEFAKKMFEDGLFDDTTLNTDYGTVLAQFNNGEAAYLIDGGWRAADITVGNYSWNQFFAIPGEKFPGAGNGGYGPGMALTKDAVNSERKEAALKLFNYLHGEEAALLRAKVGGVVPVNKTSKEVVYKEGTEAQGAYLQSLSQIADTIGDKIDAATQENFNNGIINIWLGTETPANLAETTQAIYDENK